MTRSFFNSLQSEWLKTKRSLATWIVLVGAFFTPVIIIVVRIIYHDTLATSYASPTFWATLWRNAWESIAIFLLPMGSILTTSLIAQLEYKNNTWKQLHTLPLSLATIFFSKLAIIVFMLVQFFVLFNVGIYLAALVPYLVVAGVPYPTAPIPSDLFVRETLLFFLDTLPIVGLQYLLSLHYKNFLVSIGTGVILWIAALGSLKWKFGFAVPYTYPIFNYLKSLPDNKIAAPLVSVHVMAVIYFVVFVGVGFWLFVSKREKG
ncbi:ABC transporter permease [Chryseolinea lacunae]|uniref:ABC transporter permease n=1 Tax=Chryseolinea lacunae TaxID=2801331 RepID=A0ABS1L1U2_9BACT|nr:ABC transporter permease [Chryseolinea lacunae]MBL0745493.1 ABC transporter permease [Chryseolinea lacunae]